jgi:hypothetical protein
MYIMNSIKNILQANTADSSPTPQRRGCPHEMYCLFCPKCSGAARCPNRCPPGTPREPCPKHDMVVQGVRPSSKAPAMARAGRGPAPKGPAKKPKAPAKKPKAPGFYPKYGRGGAGPKRGGAGGRGGGRGKRHPT